MDRLRAAIGSVAFLVVAPGVVAGLVPWWLTDWSLRQPLPYWMPFRAVGVVLAAGGVTVLLRTFARFVIEGLGTPAPVAPTERLVVGGLYRYVRNPMYLAVLAVIIGQALLFGQVVLVPYAGLVFAAVAAFVRWYEEPTLATQFGDQYVQYRANVPAWLPRRRAWRGSTK